jgi:hypothetical protein
MKGPDYEQEVRRRQRSTGTATFNVSPSLAGAYFVKIECFCFTEQTLEAGESVDMPVMFYIDPEIADDRDVAKLGTITLSYTFYPVDQPARVSQADAASPKRPNSHSEQELRHGRKPRTQPRLPSGRAQPLADRRVRVGLRAGGRRHHVDARLGAVDHGDRSGWRALHHVHVVARRDHEAHAGAHTPVVQLHMRYGMMLFIASEVMFFVAWFWAFFNAASSRRPPSMVARTELGGVWPPKGIIPCSIPGTCR